ncbi:MAG: hypothetical protein M3Q53_01300 [Actinomycetota bacterium]|nr:hypothetical protein [Actinomycetota bacterium]
MANLSPTPQHSPRAPRLGEAESWIGWRIDDLNGSMLGRVERVVGDDSGAPAWLVIDEFRLGDGRKFLVPAYDAVGCGGRVWSPHLRSQVRDSAGLVGVGPFTPQADRRLRVHYAASSARRFA